METDIFTVFEKFPQVLPLYEATKEFILQEFDQARVKISKTQVSFFNKHMFACISPPQRFIKSRPQTHILLTFGLEYQIMHPRILIATQPYPNRWTHHVMIQDASELNEEILDWLRLAYAFSLGK